MLPYLLKKRRTGPSSWDPTQGFDGVTTQLWLDASVGTGVTGDSDPVVTWTSAEGNSYAFTQGDSAKRPLLRTGANGINNMNAIQFDGGDDGLVLASAPLTGSVGSGYIVAEMGTVQDEMVLFSSSDELATNKNMYWRAYYLGAQPNMAITHFGTGTNDTIRGSTTIATGETRLFAFKSTGTAYEFRVDGADETEAISGGANDGDWWDEAPDKDNTTVGFLKRTTESSFFIGKIGEILVYDTNLSGANQSNVETYLANRWGITLP